MQGYDISRSSAGALAWWRMLCNSCRFVKTSLPVVKADAATSYGGHSGHIALFHQASTRGPKHRAAVQSEGQKDRVHMQAYKAIWTDPMSHAFDRQRRCNTSMEPPRQGLFGFCSDLAHVWHVHNVPMYGKFSRHAGQTQIQQGSRIPQKNGHTAALSKKCSLKGCRRRRHPASVSEEVSPAVHPEWKIVVTSTFDTNHSGAFLRSLPAAASQYVRIWRPKTERIMRVRL